MNQYIKSYVKAIFDAYSEIVFLPHWAFGAMILGVSLLHWPVIPAGILAVAGAALFAGLTGMGKHFVKQGTYIFNPLLVGLSVGFIFPPGIKSFMLALVMGVFTLVVTIACTHLFSIYFKLPVLSFPFVIVSTIIYLAAPKYLYFSAKAIHAADTLQPYLPFWAAGYFKAMGGIFFMPYVAVGIAVTVAILAASRILFFLSVLGYSAGITFSALLSGTLSVASLSYAATDIHHFNSVLTAMAVGGVFLIPSLKNYVMTVLAVCASTVCLHAATLYWSAAAIPPFTVSFNLVTLIFIYILGVLQYPQLTAVLKSSPETLLDHYLLHRRRVKGNGPAIILPFSGKWTVWQGPDGRWTHQGKWKHAYDFIITDENGKSFRGSGSTADDYYAFGKPVLAPVRGKVVKIVNTISDNPVGSLDSTDNWGNLVIIQAETGVFVKICHLAHESITVVEGAQVEPGTFLGLCGNSGYSAQPHIHIHVQLTPIIGSHTIPFCFTGYSNGNTFHSDEQPPEGRVVEPLYWEKSMDMATSPVAGDVWEYDISENGKPAGTLQLTVKMAVDGSFYFDSGRGRLYFGKQTGSFCFYGMEGNDPYLAVMLMALPRFPLACREGLTWHEGISVGIFTRGWRKAVLQFLASFRHELGEVDVTLTCAKRNTVTGTLRSSFQRLNRTTHVEWDDQIGFIRFQAGKIQLQRKQIQIKPEWSDFYGDLEQPRQ